MKIHISTLNSRISTDNPNLLDALYRLYSENTPGYQYSTAYRRRQWDGKVHFISKTGSFKTGMLNRVLEDLKLIKCVPELVYEEEIKEIPLKNWEIKGFTYYDYQKKAY